MVSHLRRMTRFEPRSGDAHKGVVRAFPAVHRGLMVAQYRRRHAGVTATGGRMGGPTHSIVRWRARRSGSRRGVVVQWPVIQPIPKLTAAGARSEWSER